MAFSFAPPVPQNYVPVIGSSFDSVAGQLQNWAGFNARINEGNANRLAAAQDNQNRYNQQVAAMQQGAVDRNAQMQSDAEGRAQTAQLAAAKAAQDQANLERQFSFDQQKEADTLKVNREQIEAGAKAAQDKFDLFQQQQAEKIDQQGTNAAVNLPALKSASDEAHDQMEATQAEVDRFKEDQLKLAAKKKADPRDPEFARLSQGNLTALQKRLDQITREYNLREGTYQKAYGEIASTGQWDITDEGITHRATGKKWSFKQAERDSPKRFAGFEGTGGGVVGGENFPGGEDTSAGTGDTTTGTGDTSGATPTPDLGALINPGFGGFTFGSGTTPPPAQVAPALVAPQTTNSYTLGRFKIIPR